MQRTTFLAGLLWLAAFPAAADHALPPDEAYQAALDDEMTIVDVRLPQEWAATGLPEGALGVPLQNPMTGEVRSAFAADLLDALDGDRGAEIALICATGGRSSFAQKLLQAAGFTRVHDLSEGMSGGPNGPGWLARGLPVEPCETC